MRSTFLAAQHYLRTFRESVLMGGWRYASRRTAIFIGNRARAVLRKLAGGIFPGTARWRIRGLESPFSAIIQTLPATPADRPLLLIVSDSQIKQCVHFRIHQKLRYLEQTGLKAMHLAPADKGRLLSFAGLAHTVIIYRTALDKDTIQMFRDAGARVIFEFDDLVVGSTMLKNSGILDQLTEHQVSGLTRLADRFLETAQASDAIIVSTPFLAQLYAAPDSGLAHLPIHVLPNFVETDIYPVPGEKNVTFAYTSPSGSVRDELTMLSDFLTSYDQTATRDWSILVMGNPLAQKALGDMTFRRGKVIARPFSDFDAYLETIAGAETVLIPLSDSVFNRSKTAIRLMDAALAGSQAVFCPVGAYRDVQTELAEDRLCVPVDDWAKAGVAIAPALTDIQANTRDLQQAVRKVYGTQTARGRYRQVFLDELQMQPYADAERAQQG
uniref:hypothetical protein n=1 Tax=Paracoccus sp. M683 TaxID=2594268 RepID=UPI00117D62D2|nr:hypothetical protein [Paracoccus sp. M683]TRW98707.1 hypothetical protein FNJ84_03895 [Paracoccus sp. M683]